ncbi:DUF397 domain-containing protein [Saccharopolyspora sp. ASAGF58]|nr:DUF397 domain-containing protein [Saccharopolyspora sp. ASAGF58]
MRRSRPGHWGCSPRSNTSCARHSTKPRLGTPLPGRSSINRLRRGVPSSPAPARHCAISSLWRSALGISTSSPDRRSADADHHERRDRQDRRDQDRPREQRLRRGSINRPGCRVRDSKAPGDGQIVVSHAAWCGFLSKVEQGFGW